MFYNMKYTINKNRIAAVFTNISRNQVLIAGPSVFKKSSKLFGKKFHLVLHNFVFQKGLQCIYYLHG